MYVLSDQVAFFPGMRGKVTSNLWMVAGFHLVLTQFLHTIMLAAVVRKSRNTLEYSDNQTYK